MKNLVLCALGLAAVAVSAADRPAKPNIVFLLADDLGGSDLRCYGHPYARTPNIDSLARDGTRFTQYQATGGTCCPTRAGLMTSWNPARFQKYPADYGYGERVTITELLKKEGYVTGHFGKWHMGPVEEPGTYGIDEIAGGNGTPENSKHTDPRGRDALVYDEAIKFIEKHKDRPFYVNVWGHIPHYPVNPVQSLVNRWRELKVKDSDFAPQMQGKFAEIRKSGGDVDDAMRRYLADIESLDDSVGRVLKCIDELGLRENTIVVFNTDQGADMEKAGRSALRNNQMGYNGAQRGGKHSHWQGGQCVPWIVRWPGHVPAGRVDKESVISGFDWLPTLCSIVGAEIKQSDFDGEDASAAWFGKAVHVRSKPLFWKPSNTKGEAMIRDGNWKMSLPVGTGEGVVELFDLRTDPAESINLASKNPEVVKELSAKVKDWVATLPTSYSKTKENKDE